MQRQVFNIEEFNLGREVRFRGEIENSILYLIHELPASKLESSAQEIKSKTAVKDVCLCHKNDLDSLLSKNRDQLLLYITHLTLDKEIISHQEISAWALKNNIFQWNPYNKIAKIFDDKYLFYVLMLANDIAQPYSLALLKDHRDYDLSQFINYPKVIIKPRHGTENIDTQAINSSELFFDHPLIKKIKAYDDCLIQELIGFKIEHKVIFLDGALFSMHASSLALKNFVMDFVDLIDQYASKNAIIRPRIFTMDILETFDSKFFILEANIRPAAIFRFQYKL